MSEDVEPENVEEENVEIEASQEEANEVTSAEPVPDNDSPDSESEAGNQPVDDQTESSSEPAAPDFEADYGDERLNEEIRSLLEPISDEAPCGQSDAEAESVIAQIEATIEPIFDTIKSDYGAVAQNDDMSSFDPTLSGSEALTLNEMAFECLREKCKSVKLCSQLPRLLMISHGLTGFRAGMDVYRAMIERFGPKLFPENKESVSQYFRGGVYASTIGSKGFTKDFLMLLFVPITQNKRLVYLQFRDSRLRKPNPGVEQRYASDAGETSPDFYVKLFDELDGIIDACKSANQATSRLMEDVPVDDAAVQPEIVNFQFIESLEKMKAIVTNLATEYCNGYPPSDDEETSTEETSSEQAVQIKAAQGEIVNREQAIELLKKIADFFHRTERHSPVSYSIRKLLEWTQMDLPELMQELLDGSTEPLSEFSKRTGIKPKSDEDSDSF